MVKKMLLIFLGISAIFFSGCATLASNESQVLFFDRQEFFNDTSQKIGVAILENYPTPRIYRVGEGGALLDVLTAEIFNSAIWSGLNKSLATADVSGFAQITDRFAEKLKTQGFEVKKLDSPLFLKDFGPFTEKVTGARMDFGTPNRLKRSIRARPQYAQVDFRPLAEKEGIDKLFLFNLEGAGVGMQFGGFFPINIIPLSDPWALAFAKGQLVDLRSNRILWRYSTVPIHRTVPRISIEGKWDEPPEYVNVKNSIKKAVENTIEP